MSEMVEIGQDIDRAKLLLMQNEVVGIPTETVYGLAGNALNEEAILKIYEVKNRPKFDPLIAHTDSLSKVEDLVTSIPAAAHRLAKKFWPGPLTLLLEKKETVPDLLTSGHNRVAVRIPNHSLTLELLNSITFPLAAPSANPFGYVSPTTANHVADQLGDKIQYILDGGDSAIGVESTIVGFENEEPVVYRLGGIAVEDLEDVIGKVRLNINVSSDPSAPGMLKSHYSPGRNLIIGDIESELAKVGNENTGIISFRDIFDVPEEHQFVLSPAGDINEAAKNLFKALRKMDHPNIHQVIAEAVPDSGLGKAINDRLRRAAAK